MIEQRRVAEALPHAQIADDLLSQGARSQGAKEMTADAHQVLLDVRSRLAAAAHWGTMHCAVGSRNTKYSVADAVLAIASGSAPDQCAHDEQLNHLCAARSAEAARTVGMPARVVDVLRSPQASNWIGSSHLETLITSNCRWLSAQKHFEHCTKHHESSEVGVDGIRVGKRVIGAQAPVIVGWENIPRVEGGPMKRFIFTWFQPVMLFAMIAFWYYAPNSIAKASTAVVIAIGFKVLLLGLEWVNPRYASWRLTWKELVTDLFYVGLGYTLLHMVSHYFGSDAMAKAIQHTFHQDAFTWFTGLPLLLQAFLIAFMFDFGQYWMHRGMHHWYPLWLPHSVHHYITQLNINKGAVGNPVELFLIGLGIGGFFDFLPRAVLIAGAFGLAIGTYQHINVRFNSPRWWRFLFNTTEHHSLHHSQDWEATRSNYAGSFIFIDRIFGTCVDGEAELLGLEGGRRMSIREQMTHPFTEAWKTLKERFDRPMAVPAE